MSAGWWTPCSRSLIARYFREFRPYRASRAPQLRLACAAMLVEAACTLPLPWLTIGWIDRVVALRSGIRLAEVLALWVALLGVRHGLDLIRFLFTERLRVACAREARVRLFRHVARLPLEQIRGRGPGYLLCRIRDDVDNLRPLWAESGIQTARALVYLIGGVVLIGSISPGSLLAALAVAPLYVAGDLAFGPRVRRLSLEGREEHGRMEGRLFESLQGITTVRLLGGERREMLEVSKRMHAWFRADYRLELLTRASHDAGAFAQALAPLLVLTHAARRILTGEMTVGTLVAFIAYAAFILEPIALLSRKSLELRRAVASLERIFELLDLPEALPRPGPGPRSSAGPRRGEGARLEFRSVSYAHEERRPLIRGIDLEVPPGGSLGVVGASGAGKTTLAYLAAGLLRPDGGSVLIDGVDVLAWEPARLRRAVGMVTQEPFLWNATIRENIRCGESGATEERIRAAARHAYADEFIRSRPEGYDTIVGSRGEALSGGERARVALARVLLRDPRLLILDEATAFLDPRSESCLRRAVRELMGTRTILVIAHRVATVEPMDEMLVLEHGRIRERGRPRALLARRGPSSRLLLPQGS